MSIINNKDWIGNNKSIYTCLGASNHSDEDRADYDYYATEPKAVDVLLGEANFKFHKDIWEPAAGELHISNKLKEYGYNVWSTDIINRNNCCDDTIDFLTYDGKWSGDIITNPPYNKALDFVKQALNVINEGNYVAMFLKLTFLESKSRKQFFLDNPFKYLFVSSSRLQCARNGDFDTYKKGTGTAVAYGWYVWEKGYKGEPIIKWIN